MTYSPLHIELFAPLVIRTLLYILPSALFLTFDLLFPSLAVEIKAQGERGLAGKQSGGAKRVRSVVGWAVLNTVLGVTVQVGVEWVVTDVLHLRSLLLIKGSAWGLNHLPNPWTMFKHLVVGFAARNMLQYYVHQYLLHSPQNTKLTHWHKTWHHCVRAPYSFVAAYDHPVCYLLHRFLPLYLPAILFRFHIMTYLILLALFSLEEMFIYSGYTILPSTIMLRGMARRTDAHMLSQGKGNFGPVGVLDWYHGTTLGADVIDDLKEEADKHDVQGRAGKAIDNAGDYANGVGSRLRSRAKKGKGNQ
jgi:hypothetical protein